MQHSQRAPHVPPVLTQCHFEVRRQPGKQGVVAPAQAGRRRTAHIRARVQVPNKHASPGLPAQLALLATPQLASTYRCPQVHRSSSSSSSRCSRRRRCSSSGRLPSTGDPRHQHAPVEAKVRDDDGPHGSALQESAPRDRRGLGRRLGGGCRAAGRCAVACRRCLAEHAGQGVCRQAGGRRDEWLMSGRGHSAGRQGRIWQLLLPPPARWPCPRPAARCCPLPPAPT